MTIHIEQYTISKEHGEAITSLMHSLEEDVQRQTDCPKFMAQLTVAEMLSGLADQVRKHAISDAVATIAMIKEGKGFDA